MKRLFCRIPSYTTRLLALIVLVIGTTDASVAACLSGGTNATIQAALNSAANTAELCQGAVFFINQPVIFNKHNGRMFTTGFPVNDLQKAKLVVTGGFDAPAVQAYSRQNTRIQNIIIDGNRSGQGNYICRQALLAIGGNYSLVDSNTLKNTKGLSALAASDNPRCRGMTITNNKILDSGFHASGGTCLGFTTGVFANGIDYRCDNGYVGHNTIVNATDGAISIYGGTGSMIEHNDIINSTRSAYSGIIAASLYGGNFTGTTVRFNDIQTYSGQHLHVALAIGTHLWCPDGSSAGDCGYGTGVSFRSNTGMGQWGWGINVEGHYNATVLDNNLIMTPWLPINCRRVPFDNYYTVNLSHATGVFQPGYVNRATHWPCLDSSGPPGQ